MGKRLVGVLALAWLGLAAVDAFAQRFTVPVYGRKTGLESLVVNALYQDRRGFLWAGTEAGLFRFDGALFRRMGPREGWDRREQVTAITEDAAGHLWVATQSGLRVGDGRRFAPVEPQGQPVLVDPGRRMAALPDGRVAFVQDGQARVVVPAPGGWRVAPLFDAATLRRVPGLREVAALQWTGGTLWLGCGHQVCELAGTRVRTFGPEQGVPADLWSGFLRARDGTLWLRGARHVRVRPAGAPAFAPRDVVGDAMDVVRTDLDVVEDPQGRVLTRTNRGLARWDGRRWRTFDGANGLPDAGITALRFDQDGALWLGTYGRGVGVWVGYGVMESWARGQGLDGAPTWAILRGPGGGLWLANELGGNVLAPGSDMLRRWPVRIHPPLRQNLAMQLGPDGALWIGSYDGRLVRYEPARGRSRLVARLPGFLHALAFDRQGRLWILTSRGLAVLEAGARQPHPVAGAPPVACSDVAQGAGDTLWFACDAGLVRLDQGRWTLLKAAGVRVPGGFASLALAPDGTVWLGANEPGLFRARIAGDRMTVAREADRWLERSIAYLVRRDSRGWLWVGGGNGVDVSDGRRWVHVSQDTGLLWDQTSQGAFFEDADGSVWIGSSLGVTHILDPRALFRQRPHRVALLSASHGDRWLADGAEVVLGMRRAPLTFRFARLGPATAALPHYRYQIEGTQAGWVDTSWGEVIVTALPAGDYRFQVQLVDDDLRSVSAPAGFSFSVPPPWWWRGWTLAVALLLLGLLLILGWRWRVRVLVAQNRRLDLLVRRRTAELRREKRELEQTRARLYLQATFDELTGLLNRRAVLEQLGDVLASTDRRRHGLAVGLIDLDHFKDINDTYGHQAGDQVLHAVARRLAEQMRPGDRLGRYGGEELLLVMEGISQEAAIHRTEALRASLGRIEHRWGNARFRVTASMGLVWTAADAPSLHELVRSADKALYAAKQAGRDRVVVAPGPEAPAS